MKKTLLIFSILLFFSVKINCQTAYTTNKDVFNAKQIMFYGYDFTNFKLNDLKRMNQDIKQFTLIWTDFLKNQADEKHLEKWLKKESIIFNFNPTINLNRKLNSENLVNIVCNPFSQDTIQSNINKYILNEKEGIALVVHIECLDNSRKTVSSYYTFFDIATRKIIMTDYIEIRDGNSYNRVSDWSVALLATVKKYRKVYLEKLEINTSRYK